jgi:hypothetical protein
MALLLWHIINNWNVPSTVSRGVLGLGGEDHAGEGSGWGGVVIRRK